MSYESEKMNEEKVFKDPVHRYIHVRHRLIWDLIGTKEFQRLRRIKQLGTAYFTFHGAEHSRFNHSLGVYEITRRIISSFEEQDEEGRWSDHDRMLCLCAALLHDLGHGPFSHSFEKVFNLDHEDFTRKIILGDTEINAILKGVSNNFPKEVAEVIEKTSKNKLAVSLISSQIDADRMDYLLRDAYYTGVSYGLFDIERILRIMRPHDEQIVIKHSGMHAVEDYIMSRHQMYKQIYFHPVSRSAEVILTSIFKRAKDLYDDGFRFKLKPLHFISIFGGKVTVEDYLKLDEGVVMYYFQIWQEEKDDILSDLCNRFINRKFFQYAPYSPELEEKLESLFEIAGLNRNYYLVDNSSSDLPYDHYRPGGDKLPINLLMKDGSLRELSQQSDLVQGIAGKTKKDHKIFFPVKDLLNAIDDDAVKQEIKDILLLRY